MATLTDVPAVMRDLAKQGDYLDAIVSDTGVDFAMPTAAEGWTIADQIGHLLWTDRVAVLAATDPDLFFEQAASFRADPVTTIDAAAMTEGDRPKADLLKVWRAGREHLHEVLDGLPSGTKIPWLGPPMGAGSMASARLMETWAHGLDITDALGVEPSVSDRLRHIADLAFRARKFAYSTNGRLAPEQPVYLGLTGPDGSDWTWGPEDAADRITGSAFDFCAKVTRRRHDDDLALTITGPYAQDWMAIAQVYAGPPGPGREPLLRAR